MTEDKHEYYVGSLIDEPSAFDDIEVWHEHLAHVKGLPDNHMGKQMMLKDADETMAWIRKNRLH